MTVAQQAIVVSELHVFPVKSCRGISVAKWNYSDAGLEYDRQWMIADEKTHNFLTARTISKMILIIPSLDLVNRTLTLTVPAYKTFPSSTHTIPIDPLPSAPISSFRIWSSPPQEGFEVGTPELIDALSNFMERRVLLVKNGSDRRSAGPLEGWTTKVLEKAGVKTAYEDPTLGFADQFPILLASQASLRDIEEHISSDPVVRGRKGFDEERWKQTGAAPLEILRFRPNIVVEGSKAWEEDGWSDITLGGEAMGVALRCARCMLPNVDPATGVRDKVVPDLVLRPYREGVWNMSANKVYFGVNIIPKQTSGILKVGDTVSVLSSFEPNSDRPDTYKRPEDYDPELQTELAGVM